VIESIRHKGLRELFERGVSAKVAPELRKRIMVRLDALEAAMILEDLNKPGFDFHPLRGKPRRYSIHVNGPWTVTFEWQEGKAYHVDLEQYH
jgi:proteic killer suppression protein